MRILAYLKEGEPSYMSHLISNSFQLSDQLSNAWEIFTTEYIPFWLGDTDHYLNILIGPVFDYDADGLADFMEQNMFVTFYVKF